MPKKKPFSGKQKKKQLQDKKRKQKDQAEASSNHGDDQFIDVCAEPLHSDEDSEKAPTEGDSVRVPHLLKVHDQPAEKTGKGEYNPNKYRLHFEVQIEEEIERRKRESQKPFEVLSDTALEVKLEDIYEPGSVLDIPKRPAWHYGSTKQQVEDREQAMFKQYLENVYDKYRPEQLSWFEHNLETWRQLWRVLEMSDIVLLITDIRHPALHFSPALYDCVVKDLKKKLVLVLNKIDLVAPSLAIAWREYFLSKFPHLHVVCFTSFPNEDATQLDKSAPVKPKTLLGRRQRKTMTAIGGHQLLQAARELCIGKGNLDEWQYKLNNKDPFEYSSDDEDNYQPTDPAAKQTTPVDGNEQVLIIGMVGHPNVGKSAIINGLMGKKVVSCSRTPGHTKHFQTIYLTPTICLCDCPGLVFPSLVEKNLQILSGMFPISQVREPYTPVGYLAARIPLVQLLGLSREKDDQTQSWSAWEICEAWAEKRRYFTAKAARPDVYRAANSILRLAVEGRLCLAMRPPSYTADKATWEAHHEVFEMVQLQRKGMEKGTGLLGSQFSSSSESESSEDDLKTSKSTASNRFLLLNDHS